MGTTTEGTSTEGRERATPGRPPEGRAGGRAGRGTTQDGGRGSDDATRRGGGRLGDCALNRTLWARAPGGPAGLGKKHEQPHRGRGAGRKEGRGRERASRAAAVDVVEGGKNDHVLLVRRVVLKAPSSTVVEYLCPLAASRKDWHKQSKEASGATSLCRMLLTALYTA